MAKTAALGITLFFLVVTCYFGFQTRTKVQTLTEIRDSLNAQHENDKQHVAKAEADLATAKADLATAKADAETAKTQAATAQSAADAATKQVTDLTAQKDQLTKDLADAKTKLGATPNNPAGIDPAVVDKLNAQLKDAQAQVAELNQVKETLSNKEKDAESRATDLEKQVDHYKSNTMKNGLEGEVLAVNQGWNFVVLSIGDRQGAVTNAEMILTRGSSQIGKVRITSVEPSTSVADIIPGSLARGVRVQPGDRVIFSGT